MRLCRQLLNIDQIVRSFPILRPARLFPLAGGRNNRVYKVEFEDRPSLVLKQYFQHPSDLRPRLSAEFSFLQYSWECGIRNIPEPLHRDAEANAALYSFLSAHPIQSIEITDGFIQQVIAFFYHLNRYKSKASHLPNASESCLCLNDYLEITERRVLQLKNIPLQTPIERELRTFVEQLLIPKWTALKATLCKAALHTDSITREERCVTPSDFGFHNALIDDSKKLYFIDFEYAGWDDPCKTVCDLFCQPKIPIPERYFATIANAFSSVAAKPDACLKRIELLFPVIQIKWCCIILNVFTRIGQSRRAFSLSDETRRQEEQLHLARELFCKIINP